MWTAAVSLLALLAVAACSSLRVPNAGLRSQGEWLTEGGSTARSNAVGAGLPLPLKEDWVYNAGGGFGPGSPLTTGAHVFVYTRNGEVHAVSLEEGKKKGADSFGESINGTPAISGTTIIIPSAWGTKHGVVAHNLMTGSHLWKYRCPPVDDGILLAGEHVIFSDARSTVHAVDLKTGTAKWKHDLDPSSAITTAPILAARSTVIVADDRGRVYALDRLTGQTQWTSDVPGPVYATPAAADGRIIVGTTRGVVSAMDVSNGNTLWEFRVDSDLVKFASPAVSDGRIVIGSSDGRVRAISADDGSLEWTWHGDGAVTAAPLIAGEQVYFGTMGRMVYALGAVDGTELWSSEVRGRVKSAPALYGNAVYFQSEPRYLYRFTPEDESYVRSD